MSSVILIAEDEASIADAIEIYLKSQGYQTLKAANGAIAWELLQNNTVDLAIIDVMMPVMDGIALTMKIRELYEFPIIILSAKSEDIDKITGLNIGADDYVTKPFHLAVLRARIQNLLRMTAKEDKSVYEDARFRFDFAKLYYQKDGQTVVLSNTEQKLLKLLVDNQKTTLSRQMLIDRVWTDGAEYVDENALSVAISRLRNKLEDTLSRPMFIQNVYGIGYVWQPAKEKTWRG